MNGVKVYENHHVAMIALTGRLDAFTATQVRQLADQLFARGITHIIIDLAQTPLLDSAGVAVLVYIFKRCRAINGHMHLAPFLAPAARRMLHLTRFEQIFATIEADALTKLLPDVPLPRPQANMRKQDALRRAMTPQQGGSQLIIGDLMLTLVATFKLRVAQQVQMAQHYLETRYVGAISLLEDGDLH
ncbi:MAG: STAS domain-containing protein [Caldilineaceae bacterium]